MTVNGVTLHYREWGVATAPMVVLLHGSSAHAGWWDDFATAFADRFRVIALDLRGHGDSAHVTPPAYRIADYAADLQSLATQHAWPAFHLVGHSLGGMVAAAVAAQAPTLLGSLVVVDTGLRMNESGARYMRRLRQFVPDELGDHESAMRRFVLLPKQTCAAPEHIARIAAASIRQMESGGWSLKFDRATMEQFEPVDLLPPLRQLGCPILFVRGELSAVLTPERLRAIQAALPHASVAEVPGAHHHLMLDNPGGFESAVATFLACVAR